MTNPLRGEVPLVLGDRTLKLRMGINALCAAEPVLGKKTRAILDDLEDTFDGPAMDTIRVLTWAGLNKYHPEVHLFEVGELMEEFGSQVFLQAVLKGLASAFGTEAKAEGKKGANPPKRRKTGTG